MDLSTARWRTARSCSPASPKGSNSYQFYVNNPGLDARKKISAYTAAERKTLLHGSEGHTEIFFKNGRTQKLRFEGLAAAFTRRNIQVDESTRSEKSRVDAERFISEGTCPVCDGARLNEAALASQLGGIGIAEWCGMQVSDLAEFVGTVDDEAAAALVKKIRRTLTRIVDIGLGYFTLDRATASLSGGEGQRLKLVKHLDSDLVGLTYVFDEPSIGMHPRDVGRSTTCGRRCATRAAPWSSSSTTPTSSSARTTS